MKILLKLDSLYNSLSKKGLIFDFEDIISNSTALPEECFEVLHFYFEDCVSQEEIASKLCISNVELRSRINKLKRVFKAKELATLLLSYLTCLYQMKNDIPLSLIHIDANHEVFFHGKCVKKILECSQE